MSYTYPNAGELDLSFENAATYTRPPGGGANFEFVAPGSIDGIVFVNTMLGVPSSVVGEVPQAGVVAANTSLRAPIVTGRVAPAGFVSVDSPLVARVIGFHDFTAAIPDDAIDRWHLEVLDENNVRTRIPISSWQATLQIDAASFVQCVVPSAVDWMSALRAGVRFEIIREVQVGDTTIATVMAAAPLESVSVARGPFRFTATIQGYGDPFAATSEPDPIFDRAIVGERQRFESTSSMRLRCSIDWLLKPGLRAIVDDRVTMDVGYINYYVTTDGDSYMDVGSRAVSP